MDTMKITPKIEYVHSGIPLEEGYEGWCVTIEHPDRVYLDQLSSTHQVSTKLAQWALGYSHGSFPSSFEAGMVVSFSARSYVLLAVGSNTLRVQALTPEAFFAERAPYGSEIIAFQGTPARTERIDNRQRPKRGCRLRRTVDTPQFAPTSGLRPCYEVFVRHLPRTLCDELPVWARGGSEENPVSQTRVCYVQPYILDKETNQLQIWHLGSALPDHCKVALTMAELAATPVFRLTRKEAVVLVRLIEYPVVPSSAIFVAPASFLEDAMRVMIAPGISFPASSVVPAHAQRVSLESGSQVAIPKQIACRRINELNVSSTTCAYLEGVGIRTLGEFLELEEEQVMELLNQECLWEMQVVLAKLGSLPIYAGEAPSYPENTLPQEEKILTRLPHFELAALNREQVLCELDDASVQKASKVREREGILQVQRISDGKWVAPKRFWTSLKRSQQIQNEHHVPHASSLSGFLPTDEPEGVEELPKPIFAEFYYELTDLTYEDKERGRLHMVYATALVDRLTGRQGGAVQVLWLTASQVAQSVRWESNMKHLDTHTLQAQVHTHAAKHGTEFPVILSSEEKALARKEEQLQMEERYNRVPLRDPYGTGPLELFIRDTDLDAADARQLSPTGTILKVLEHYCKYPQMLPSGDHLPAGVLREMSSALKEDQRQIQQLNAEWVRRFPGEPNPNTARYVLHRAVRTKVVWDAKMRKKVIKEEHIGYRVIIGVLTTVAVPERFTLEPRRGKPMMKAPEPIAVRRMPKYVIRANAKKTVA